MTPSHRRWPPKVPAATPATPATPVAPGSLPPPLPSSPSRAACPPGAPTVRDASGLRAALAAARPGTVIRMADGTYPGGFRITASGTRTAPIFLCGSRAAVLDDGGDTNYVLHVDRASWWQLEGFTVRNGKKGVMADGARDIVLSGLFVVATGDEAVHLRAFSTDNLVTGVTVRDTGRRSEKFGEGIYVGSVHSNWCDHSDCELDASDRNSVVGNDVAGTTAESIDVKEGTTGGLISGNTLSGEGMTAADFWIDLKGNGWTVERNTGDRSSQDGIQTHVVADGWGRRNVIRANRLVVDGPGYGVYVHKRRAGNVVGCDNVVVNAEQGFSSVPCVP